MRVLRRVLFLLCFTVSLSGLKAKCQTDSGRGFGKITPGYQSFYYVRKQLPFFLVDDQGRNAAEILVYVKADPGKPIRHEVQGTTQYDHDVPLHVVVRNLTQDCAVSVEWLDFDFREDGQASSRGLGTPPGANPNTSVPAGGSYTHIFRYKAVTTFKAGKPVLNEVLPAISLQCSAEPRGASPKGATAPTQKSSTTLSSPTSAILALKSVFPIIGNEGVVRTIKGSDGCSVTFGLGDSSLTKTVDFTTLHVSVTRCESPGGALMDRGWIDLFWDADNDQIPFDTYDSMEDVATKLHSVAKACKSPASKAILRNFSFCP